VLNGTAETKMRQRGSSTNSVIFKNCRIVREAIFGQENDGFRVAVTELAGGRIGNCSIALGIATAAMDLALQCAGYVALQLLGGAGYTEEYPLERYARDVRVTSIYEGTSKIQRIIIARELLREAA
jgi:alkylation response protein AidB-like acyl-CoA dehydrogenase